MEIINQSPTIHVGKGPLGWGVFCARSLSENHLIESCPVVIVPASEVAETMLANYCFFWRNDQPPTVALPFGHGMLYNHHANANVGFRADYENGCMNYFTLRPVEAGEELFIDYGYTPDHLDLIDHPAWYHSNAQPG
jgi:uncharacterized protein